MSETDQTPVILRDPALDQLDKVVGDWVLEGTLAGSDEAVSVAYDIAGHGAE